MEKARAYSETLIEDARPRQRLMAAICVSDPAGGRICEAREGPAQEGMDSGPEPRSQRFEKEAPNELG